MRYVVELIFLFFFAALLVIAAASGGGEESGSSSAEVHVVETMLNKQFIVKEVDGRVMTLGYRDIVAAVEVYYDEPVYNADAEAAYRLLAAKNI